MFKTSAIHPPPNKLGGGLLAEDDKKMKMKLINGWKSRSKQWDKIEVKVRISFLTLFELNVDVTARKLSITLLNLTVSLG